jgi:hypothetical protein
MSGPNKAVNTFRSGLNLSVDSINQPKDTYSYALNAIKQDSINNPEILTNEKGFETYFDLGYNYVLLGTIYLGKENYVLFIKNTNGSSVFNRIILYVDQVATTILDNLLLNFSTIIKGTYRINYKNERIIYWVDGINEDRVLNIDGTIITDITKLALDIQYIPAILSSKSIDDNNGSLVTGTYEFYGSYKSPDNAITPWFILNANPIYIIQDAINVSSDQYINIEGCDSGVITSKSIKLELSNLDDSYNKFRLGVIKTINGTQTAHYIDDIFYNTDTKEIIYSGYAIEILIPSIADLTTDQAKYYGSNAIIQSGNRLLRANTKGNKIFIDYQSLANNIVVDYYIQEDLVGSMPNSSDYNVRSNWWKSAATKYTDEKTLLRDEVYNVGIAFGLIKEGLETEVFHIPGRALNSIPTSLYETEYSDTGIVSSSSTWDSQSITENGETVPKWTVQNTAAKSTDGAITKLAYYESQERYPSGFDFPVTGSTNNGTNSTNVRFHKIPSAALEPIYRQEIVGGNFNFYKRNIGLSFSNIEVPVDLKDNISYIRIYITPRNIDSNKSIIAKGAFINCALTKTYSFSDLSHTPTDNYWIVPIQPYNDQDDELNHAIYQTGFDPSTSTANQYHSFYSPDTLLKNPTINTDRVYIENEITGTVHYYNTQAQYINVDPAIGGGNSNRDSSTNGGYKRDLFYNPDDQNRAVLIPTKFGVSASQDVYNINNTFKSTYRSICIFNKINKILSTKSRRKLKKGVYVPFNARLGVDQIGNMDNPYYSPYGPANVLLELDPAQPILGNTETTDTSVDFLDNNINYNLLDDTANDGHTRYGTFHFHSIPNPTAVYRYGSIKRTNPSQYGAIAGATYSPTDLVVAKPTFDINNKLTTSLKGLIGDSYIDMFSVKRVRFASKQGYTYGGLIETSIGISTFFTESTVNTRLRYAEGTDYRVFYPKVLQTIQPSIYLDWGTNPNIVNRDNYYKENPDFDKITSKQNFGVSQLDIDTKGQLDYSTRIVYSEKLLDETVSDSYRVFLSNNYRDLTKNTGSITHLFNKEQELYAITRDSLWKLFATNQTIKSNSTENITIGTGEFLANDPVEMLSIEGGYAGSSSKASLVETPYGYFYCDRYKGRFILFDNQQKDVSLIGVNSFIEENFKLEIVEQIKTLDAEFDNPLENFGYLVGYEAENNRILVTKLDYKFTTESFTSYKGIYNPSTTYSDGDIYLRDGIFYEYNSTVTAYVTIDESSNLSSFTPSTIDTISYTLGSVSHGTVIKDPTDNTKILYTPTTNYLGTDAFNVTIGCTTTSVDLNIINRLTVPNYTITIADTSANGTTVQTVVGTYAGHTFTYAITSGNGLGVFTINATTGVITVLDNSTINYDIQNQYVLGITTTADDTTTVNSTVTVNLTRTVASPTHPNATVTISQVTPIGTNIYTIAKASYPHPVSPSSTLIYSVLSESNPGLFTSNLVDPDNMHIDVVTTLPISPTSFTITYHAEDNLDPSKFVNFTITITYPAIAYYNTEQHQVFTKNDCTSGQSGTSVDYVVPAHTYGSSVSQADADNQALADIAANGQNYANTHGTCLVTSLIGTLLIDYYTDEDADLCAYCDTVGVTETGIIVTAPENNTGTGVARYPNDGRDPSGCYLLSSNRITTLGTTKMRFGINMAYFISTYPAIDTFKFVVRGRSSTSAEVFGIYALRDISQGHLIMPEISTGSSTYIPSVSAASTYPIQSYDTHIVSGADGTVSNSIGSPILQLEYTVSTNTLIKTTY